MVQHKMPTKETPNSRRKPRVGVDPIAEIFDFKFLGRKHPMIKELLKEDAPEIHGGKVWTASWLLLDYLERIKMNGRTRVLEVGCGWGVTSIYCAKTRKARVTALDADGSVFPILRAQADANGIEIKTVQQRFESIPMKLLKEIDIIVGADICFWDELVDPLLKMIRRALRAGVKRIVLADPGRPCFEDLAALVENDFRALLIDTDAKYPAKASGYVLVVEGEKPKR